MSQDNEQIEWYIARDGQQHGPLSQAELDKFIEFGHLKPTDLLWRAGFADWRLAADVFQGPPPAATPPEPPGIVGGGPAAGEGVQHGAARHHQGGPAGRAAATSAPHGAGAGEDGREQSRTFADAWEAAEQRRGGDGQTVAAQSPDRAVGATRGAAAHGGVAAGFEAPGGAGPGMGAPGRAGLSDRDFADDGYDDDEYDYDDYETERRSGWLGIAATILILALIGAGGWFAYNNQAEIASLYADLVGERSTGGDDISIIRGPEEAPRSAITGGDGATPSGNVALQPAPQPTPTTASISRSSTFATDAPGLAGVPLLKSQAWAFAEREFPTWAEKQLDVAKEMAAAEKSVEEINGHLVDAFVAFRRDNAALALLASPQRLQEVAGAFVESLKALTERGAESCYAFISSGEGTASLAPAFFEPGVGDKIDAQMLAIMGAIVDAKAKPITRSPPRSEDFDKLSSELNQRGWSDADLKLFSNPDALSRAKPEVVCRLVTEWFATQATLGDPAARDRLIAASLRPVIGG